ncbi:hypothetical protein [Tardiphaga alba]|uniref:hypothetical protein n=1 Tax=Tardiphaga alba TaxID=340268 RepID=UPI0020122671|nr:hypothetical protein [Tardiphaga alba]
MPATDRRSATEYSGRLARWCVGLFVTSALVALAAPAGATDWTGSISNDWWDGANWSTGTPPDSAVTANIDTTSPNAAVLSGSSASVGELSVGVSATGAVTVSNTSLFRTTSILAAVSARQEY